MAIDFPARCCCCFVQVSEESRNGNGLLKKKFVSGDLTCHYIHVHDQSGAADLMTHPTSLVTQTLKFYQSE
jgi:hypothetical protein